MKQEGTTRTNIGAKRQRTSDYSYEERVNAILEGHGMIKSICGTNTRHPQIEIYYTDFKPVGEVRRMLEQAMPHVDFVTIEREFSQAALVTALMCRSAGWDDDEDIKVITPDNRIMPLYLYMWDEAVDRDFTDLSWQRERYIQLPDVPKPENQQE